MSSRKRTCGRAVVLRGVRLERRRRYDPLVATRHQRAAAAALRMPRCTGASADLVFVDAAGRGVLLENVVETGELPYSETG
jgi:hypothetical protein